MDLDTEGRLEGIFAFFVKFFFMEQRLGFRGEETAGSTRGAVLRRTEKRSDERFGKIDCLDKMCDCGKMI
jgi:hypothetical protein